MDTLLTTSATILLFLSVLGYAGQIVVFLATTFSGGAEDTFDNKWEYLALLIPFACWYFLFKGVITTLKKF